MFYAETGCAVINTLAFCIYKETVLMHQVKVLVKNECKPVLLNKEVNQMYSSVIPAGTRA